MTDDRWMGGQTETEGRTLPQPLYKPDSPLTPLQERGIVTTGKRGLSVPAIPEHPLSPPETGGVPRSGEGVDKFR